MKIKFKYIIHAKVGEVFGEIGRTEKIRTACNFIIEAFNKGADQVLIENLEPDLKVKEEFILDRNND